MPDQLTPHRARAWRRTARLLALLVLFPAAGLLAGYLWELWWQPVVGVVVEGELRFDLDALGRDFSGTATYAVLALGAGVLLGLCAVALAGRDELATLAVVTIGSCAAALVMWQTGQQLGPPDPAPLVGAAADGDRVSEQLTLASPGLLALWPLASLTTLGTLFLVLPRRFPDTVESL